MFIEKIKNKNQRPLQWSLAFQEYNLQIRHIKGHGKVIADALSRVIIQLNWTPYIHSHIVFLYYFTFSIVGYRHHPFCRGSVIDGINVYYIEVPFRMK